ncbi:hypothetical protein GGR57DRAFT_502131 [Xylariaceae sp. FL1272]|nr:hypothetical protein GGR57DRAFT_502131 [Xylariaceae sp. FL1272]
MQNNTNSNAPPGAIRTNTAPSVIAPTNQVPQTHGYPDPGLNSHSHLHSQVPSPATSDLAPTTMQRGITTSSEGHEPATGSPTTNMAAQALMSHDHDHDHDHTHDEDTSDGRKAKRELSSSKRAAQNRAAQRAFRQRKEHYIKKLEQQVREYGEMEQGYRNLQNDNLMLRDYIIKLQSRLLDMQVELPPPPANINLAPPPPPAAGSMAHNGAPLEPSPSQSSAGTLADVAAAVAGYQASGPANERAFKSENGPQSHHVNDVRRPIQDVLPPPSSLQV